MTKKLVEDITAANAALFRTTEKLLEAADEVKRDRQRLLQLLREAAEQKGFQLQTAADLQRERSKAERAGKGVPNDG